MRRGSRVPLLALATLVAIPSLVHAITIDTYVDALPPHPDLPHTQARVLWLGPYCDDSACPPGTAVLHDSFDFVQQLGLTGAQGADRAVQLQVDPPLADIHAVLSIDPTTQTLRIAETNGLAGVLIVYISWTKAQGLNLNLTSGGANAIGFDISGFNLNSPEEGIDANLTFRSNAGESYSAGFGITSPGPFEAPFDAYSHEVDLSDIDEITLTLFIYVGVADISVGPLHTVEGPTAVRTATWGQVKSMYR